MIDSVFKSKIHMAFSYVSYICIVLLIVGFSFGGYYFLLPMFFAFLLVPAFDLVVPLSLANFNENSFGTIDKRLLQFAPIGYVLISTFFIYYSIFCADNLSNLDILFLGLGLGTVSAIMITACHELIHKKDKFRKYIGRLGLATLGYLYFEHSHLSNHHRDVCTADDNHTAFLNESFYKYLVRSKINEFMLFKKNEELKVRRKGVSFYSISNTYFIQLLLVCLIFILLVILGPKAACVYFVQYLVAILSLEAAAYIEHYGLTRESKNDKVLPKHSWDSYHFLSNYLLFFLPRHSSHHQNPRKEFYLLEHRSTEAYEMPFSYPTMIGLALVPELWFKLIDPIIKKRNRDLYSHPTETFALSK